MDEAMNKSVEQVVNDLKQLVRDSEDLLKAGVGELNEKGREAQTRLKATVESAKITCRELENKALSGARVADKVVREHPYETIGVAFGVGLLIGVLVNRRS